MAVLKRFPRVWCPTCDKTQPMIFDVMKANDKNDHDAADIVCAECKSIIATLRKQTGRSRTRDKGRDRPRSDTTICAVT
jgi:hypothetical protein